MKTSRLRVARQSRKVAGVTSLLSQSACQSVSHFGTHHSRESLYLTMCIKTQIMSDLKKIIVVVNVIDHLTALIFIVCASVMSLQLICQNFQFLPTAINTCNAVDRLCVHVCW